MNKEAKLLNTPPGSKPFYKKEARFRNFIEKKLTGYFEKWDFSPFEPPIIDYFDVYSDVLNSGQKKSCIRFVDRDGELILLRNDITLFAAKLVAARLKQTDVTLRYYYSDQIIRCEKSGSPQEYYQIGCEIVGNNFNYQELEILCILLESLELLEIEDSALHIGDISFYRSLLLPHISEDDFMQILEYIRFRDSKLVDFLNNAGLPKTAVDDCIKAAGFIGSLEDLLKIDFSEPAKNALKNLIEKGTILKQLGHTTQIIFDLSELSGFNYYNGITFNLYAQGIEVPIASGGRYDLLFEKLGLSKNAVGFSFWLYPLEKLLSRKLKHEETDISKITVGNDPANSLKQAITQVRNDEKISLEY